MKKKYIVMIVVACIVFYENGVIENSGSSGACDSSMTLWLMIQKL